MCEEGAVVKQMKEEKAMGEGAQSDECVKGLQWETLLEGNGSIYQCAILRSFYSTGR